MNTTIDPSVRVTDPMSLPKENYKVVRRQKIVLKPKNLILSDEELNRVKNVVQYHLDMENVIMIPEGFDVYIVDQDYVIKEN